MPFGIEHNVFKRHAACYYTHSAIEAAEGLVRENELDFEDIESVVVGLQPALHSVCDIADPTTGLEVKFSIRHLVAMAILGRVTRDPALFTQSLAQDADIRGLRARTTVVSLETANRMLSSVTILSGGRSFERTIDVSTPSEDLDQQEIDLVSKFNSLAEPVLGPTASGLARRILDSDGRRPVADLCKDLALEAQG